MKNKKYYIAIGNGNKIWDHVAPYRNTSFND